MIATGLSGTDIASPAYHVAADYNRDGMIAAKIYIPYDY